MSCIIFNDWSCKTCGTLSKIIKDPLHHSSAGFLELVFLTFSMSFPSLYGSSHNGILAVTALQSGICDMLGLSSC